MPSPTLRALALRCVFAAGVIGGSGAAAREPGGFWLGDVNAPVPSGLRGARVIDANALQSLLARGVAVVVDVSDAPRPPAELAPGAPWLPLPHPVVPGALWIPGAGAGVLSPDMDAFFRTRLQAALVNADTPLVFYCHEHCWLSWNAAKRALAAGFRHVDWFAAGIEGWTAAGGPTVPGLPIGPGAPSRAAAGASPDQAPTGVLPAAGGPRPSLAILDLELTGDLGGPAFEAEHAARLAKESARLRADMARAGLYRIVANAPAQASIDTLKSEQAYLHDCNGCDLDVGRELDADRVMVAWVNRVSGLILTLTYEIHDVKTRQISARKSFDFRGDSDIAWDHAIDYMVRDLQE